MWSSGGTDRRESSPLALYGPAAAALVVGFALLLGLTAIVIPWTENARDAAQIEQFQQQLADLAAQDSGRLSLQGPARFGR